MDEFVQNAFYGENRPKNGRFPQKHEPHDHPTNPMKWTLRDYQKRFCRSITDAFEGQTTGGPFDKVLGTAATGAGKTIMAAALIWYWTLKRNERCLFLADSDELCEQSVTKLHRSAGIIADLEKASSRASREALVVVGSIQTMQQANRLGRWPQSHFGKVIADEAHLSMADGWQRVLGHFAGGGAQILGITATPERGDKRSLMRFYDHIAADIPLAELIAARHLSPIVVQTVPIEIRITSKIKDGEGDNEAIAAELEAYYEAIIRSIPKDRKKFLWFHPSVAASRKFASLLMRAGESAAHVDGSSPDRAEIIEGFAQNRFKHLNNCQMLVKGYDCPDIDTVVILRPTKGRTPYTQMAGRGTRLYCPHGCTEWCDHPDRKQNMLLLDYLWEFEDHDVMGPADLWTDKPEQKKALAAKLKQPGEQDLLQADEFITGEREADLLAKLKTQAGKRGRTIDALALGALLHQPDLLDYEPVARWQTAPATPNQLDFLAKIGIDRESILDKGHASKLVGTLQTRMDAGRATLKQIAYLTDRGYKDAHRLSFDEANRALDAMNGKQTRH